MTPRFGFRGAMESANVRRWLPRSDACLSSQQHNRRFRRSQELLFEFGNFAASADALERREHDGERLLFAMLALAQALDRFARLRASTINWKPPMPLSATIFPARISSRGRRERGIAACARVLPNEFQNCSCGPQRGQAIGSAWKRRSAGSRYSRRAILAHREFFHRGIGAIVGQRFDDGETRAAIGAVGEGIAKTAIVRVQDFAQAVAAGRDVRQNQRALSAVHRCFHESRNSRSRAASSCDDSQLWMMARAGFSARKRRAKFGSRPRGVPSISRKTPCAELRTQPLRSSSRGQPVNERPKSHALDRAADHRIRSWSGPRCDSSRSSDGSGSSPGTEKTVDETDLVNEEQSEAETEEAGRRAEVAVQKLESASNRKPAPRSRP